MKLKIKVKVLTEGCMPEINPSGDWIDLRAVEVFLNLNIGIQIKVTTVVLTAKLPSLYSCVTILIIPSKIYLLYPLIHSHALCTFFD